MKQPDFLPIHDIHCTCARCKAPRSAYPHGKIEERAPHGTGFFIALLIGVIAALGFAAFLR